MITMMVAPMLIIQLLLVWYVLLIVLGIMLVMWQLIIERRAVAIIEAVILLIISQLVYLPLRALEQFRDKGRRFASWLENAYTTPLELVLILTVLVTALILIVLKNSLNWRNNHISRTSVYESLQKLPVGICCYQDGGMTRLVNVKMSQIAKELTGKKITNGEIFVQSIKETAVGEGKITFENDDDLSSIATEANTIVAKARSGRVYSFALTDIPFRNIRLHEILATDVTQEYINLMALHKDKKRMQDINNRLRAYSKGIIDVNIEKEILDAKVRIHDELGHALIVSKRYLRSGDGDREAILNLWRKNIALLKDEREEDSAEDYETMFYIAECAGVDIIVDGELPQDNKTAKKITVTAISECLTNVCRHTHGNQINITVNRDGSNKIRLSFTNNGDAPRGEIKEGGGLTNLRKIVEGAGGKMEIQSAPVFELRLVIPIGDFKNE